MKDIDLVLDAIDTSVFDTPHGIFKREYILACGTKVRDELNLDTGVVDRYVLPIIPTQRINIDAVITKDDCVMTIKGGRNETM